MRDCLVLALWIAVASAANCVGENPCRPVSPNAVDSPASISKANSIGEQYVLRMEEVSGPPPRIEHVVGAPNVGTGWLDVANGAFEKIQIGKSIELPVSTTSQFHLTFRDRGDSVELDGMLQKIPIVPAKQAAPAPWQPKLEKAVGEQGPDFSLHVEYNYARKNGRCVGLKSEIPIRFGKKWCLQGTSVFPATLWSLNRAETKSTK